MDWAEWAGSTPGPGPGAELGSNLSWANASGAEEAEAEAEAEAGALAAAVRFRDASRFWVQRVLVPAVVTVGVLGNLVTVVVLTRRRMRSSTNMYLTALAASDLLYLVFMFSMSLEHYPSFRDPAYLCYWEYKPFGLWFTDATMNIAHYEELCGLLTPAIPLASFQLHSGSVWDQSRSRNFRSTLRLLLAHYTHTLESVQLHVKNNRERLDDLLLELLGQCPRLAHLQYDGVLRDMDTVRRICELQLGSRTSFQTMHVRPKTLNAYNRTIVKDICTEYVHKLAEQSVDFKIEDPSSVIMYC